MISARRADGTPRAPGRALQEGLIKGALLFLAGLFAGANLLYFVLSRQPAGPAASRPDATPQATEASAPASRSSSEVPSSAEATTSGAGKSATRVPPPSIPGTRPGPAGVAAVAGLQPLLIPVQGVGAAQLQDTFTDSRAQGRSHEAIDIMAPAGTPVLAVADGTVEKLFTSDAGGLTVYQFEPSGRYAYYYAHLQGYAPGLAEKQALRRGDVIGYVGSTGNANPVAPHLHFAVFELGPERRWWQGTAINPYPLLHRP